MQARLSLIFAISLLIFISACSSAENAPTATPLPTFTPVPSSTSTTTPIPTNTPGPTDTPTITPTLVTIELVPGEGEVPPIDITLPDGWTSQFYGVPIEEIDGDIRIIQVAGYSGPVTDGTGFVILVWGFANIAIGNPLTGGEQNLFLDGLRFWRLQIMEQGCNIGTDLQRNFTVGGLPAVGTFVSAVECPESPDTAGWFAGLQNSGINFLFYVFTDPREAIENDAGAPVELQTILDSVDFHVDDMLTQVALTPSPEVTEAP